MLLVGTCAWAGLRAIAARHFLAAQTLTVSMLETGELDQVSTEDAGRRIDLALRLFPRHPDYLDLAGQIKELKATQTGVLGKKRRDLLESAADYYRNALAVRPLWPYGWANLLSVKDKLGQVDMEFKIAMRRAAETGPWEPPVQLELLTVGLRHWEQLSGFEKDLVRAKTKDALRVQPRKVFLLVQSFGRPDLVCDESLDYLRIKQWCSRVFWKTWQ